MSQLAENDVQSTAGPGENGDAENGERGRSTIVFPYTTLTEAERIAREVSNFAGTATPDGIANALGQKTKSGAFRQKLSAARIFGLVSTRPGQVTLTRLGRSVLDPERRDGARVEAFLAVPLYKAIYEKYKGDLLPEAAPLELEMRRLGVSEKQTATARQVFHRSAELAGFFRRGSNRLIAPDATEASSSKNLQDQTKKQKYESAGLPEPIAVLLESVLRDGDDWSPEQTKAVIDGARLAWRGLTGG